MQTRSDMQEIKCYKLGAAEKCVFRGKKKVEICVIFGYLPQHHVSAKNWWFR